MKKICLLMALVICLGCVLFTACKNDDTDSPEESVSETITDAGDESNSESDSTNTTDSDNTTDTSDTTESIDTPVLDENDAVADDIYDNVGPEIYG